MESSVPIRNMKGFVEWLNTAVAQQPGTDQAGKLGRRLGAKTPTINKWRQGNTQSLGIAYISNIARYLGGKWTPTDVKAWLQSSDGTSIADFKDNHEFSEVDPSVTTIGGRVQEVAHAIESLHENNGLTPDEKIFLILKSIGNTFYSEDEPKLDLPPEWVEVLSLFPKERMDALYQMGEGIPSWRETIDEVFAQKKIPASSVISATCLIMKLHSPGKLRLSPEEIELMFEHKSQGSIQPESKVLNLKGGT